MTIDDLFPPSFPYHLMWDDPLTEDLKDFPGAVLRGEIISRYVSEYNLIFDKKDFDPEHLKGASYTTRPAPNQGWAFDEKGTLSALRISDDSKSRSFYVVPANSLVFIRLREILRVPFYLIARFNLKITYVYQGLLLGTGPQVDPGYTGQIYIPLHNLTDRDVLIDVNDSFVSFDFVRTTGLPRDIDRTLNLKDFFQKYKDPLHLIDIEKLIDRNHLLNYVGKARPHSSLGSLVTTLRRIRAP